MATYYEYKGSWYLQWRENGKRVKEWVGRVKETPERQVRIKLQAKELELSTGQRILPTGLIFRNFAEDYLQWYATEYPASHERVDQIVDQHLLPFFGDSPIDAIAPFRVEQYKAERLKKVKAGSVVKELRTLKAMINRAVEWDLITRNPVARVKPPQELDSKPPHYYTVEELVKLYEISSRAPVWRLYANTGMRRMEGLNLKKADVGSDAIRVLSTEEGRTKSRKWREIPMTEGARQALDEIKPDGSFVIPRIRPESLSRAFLQDVATAKMGGSLHSLRHTYISHLVMAGVPLRTVQILAGHAHFSTTEKYAHLAPGHLRDAGLRISL